LIFFFFFGLLPPALADLLIFRFFTDLIYFSQDEHKLLPYSVNLECKVSKNITSYQKPKRTAIRNGIVCITHLLWPRKKGRGSREKEIDIKRGERGRLGEKTRL
jgi:hypothetical protein